MSQRSVSKVLDSIRVTEGGGFPVTRPFPTEALADFDPFLLLDEMGPVQWAPGEATGAPDHPHRGFETVTYLFSGEMEHRDSHGNRGTLRPGDVQWMTAGDGVIHSEMPAPSFKEQGGLMHGVQLWVNLPAADKMMRPRYQDIPATRIPVVSSDDGRVTVRVIAGEAMGHRAVIDTRIPITYLHFTVQAGGSVEQKIPADHNSFAYVVDGSATFGRGKTAAKTTAKSGQMVVFSNDGDGITAAAEEGPVSFLLISGRPLNEPIARYGPFVMNRQREIAQAIKDYQSGVFGTIPPDAG